MATKTVSGGNSPPGQHELDALLGRASVHWTRLRAELTSQFGDLAEKWSYSRKTGHWSLQLKQKKRTVLYMIVLRGHFQAAFALGEKACAAARMSGLPASVIEVIEGAPRYAEGRGVWLNVRNRKDVDNVKRLAAIKMAN